MVDGVTTEYVLDVAGGLPEVIVATTGGVSTWYVQVQGQILAEYEAGAWAYVLPDALADAAGQVTLAQSYDPFGVLNSQHRTQNSQLLFGYTGEWWDAEAELLYLRARYYDPAVGRFLSKDPRSGDPRRPVSYNAWLYGYANPLRYVDLSGYFSCIFETADVETYLIQTSGWDSCEAPIEFVLNVLDDKGGNVSSSVVWAFRDAEKHEGIKITFTNQGNPLGGRSRFPERGIVFINGYDLSEDFKENALGGDPNALAYISILAHEFWHATMQPAGTANNPAGEQMAFIVQKEVLKELGGAQGNLDFLQEIIDNPAAYGYIWNPKILLQTCLALTFDNPFTSPYMPDRNVLRRLEEFPGQ